jgi:hypothetical protein
MRAVFFGWSAALEKILIMDDMLLWWAGAICVRGVGSGSSSSSSSSFLFFTVRLLVPYGVLFSVLLD